MRKQKGIALIVVMLALGVLAVITLAISYLASFGLMQSRSQRESEEALYTAQAGLSLKLAQLRIDDTANISGTMSNSAAAYQTDVFSSGETVWPGFTVPGTDTYYILSQGTSDDGRVRRIGMLVQKSSTDFSAAILAGNSVILEGASYTDTYDSSDPSPVAWDHTLANIGVWSTTATISVDAPPV